MNSLSITFSKSAQERVELKQSKKTVGKKAFTMKFNNLSSLRRLLR